MKIENILILFWIYAILGWILEFIVTYIRQKRFINRGFLIGPYCPIYGVGGIALLSLSKYHESPFIVFVLSIFICSLIEYIASYILELIYKIRWWDYSNRFLNVNGRICLTNSITFGFLGVLMVCYMNPFVFTFLDQLSPNIIHIISSIIISITFLDILITILAMFDIRDIILNYKDKDIKNIFKRNTDRTEEISSKVRSIIKDKSFIHKHLIKAFSNLKVKKIFSINKKDLINKVKKINFIESIFVIGIILSIVLGFILGNIFDNTGLIICVFLVIDAIIVKLLNRGNDEK